jgi:TatA/E family protein of Tat protein translocase
VILVVALLVFGPNKMPEIGRQLARGVREFRKVQHHLSSELRGVVSEFDLGDSDDDDAPTAAPTPPRPGGDPVPMLPAKAGDPAPAADPAHRADGADGAEGTDGAADTLDATTTAPTAAPTETTAPDRVLPRTPDPEATSNGESPPVQPSDST